MFTGFKATVAMAAVAGALMALPARADYLFSGTGASGNLFPGVENWQFDANISGGVHNWGSPGVGAGVTAYSHVDAAYGFDITFTGGGTINTHSIDIGNGAGCQGSTSGGTTFCTISPTDIWVATLVGPSSIAFRAQNPTFYISNGQDYFVNVFFDGAAPESFEGRWLTDFSPDAVPEPASLALFGLAMAGLGLVRRRKAA